MDLYSAELKYFSKGLVDVSTIDDYHSHNTEQLNVEQTERLLLKLDIIRKDLNLQSE